MNSRNLNGSLICLFLKMGNRPSRKSKLLSIKVSTYVGNVEYTYSNILAMILEMTKLMELLTARVNRFEEYF